MNYDKSKESVGKLRAFKKEYEKTTGVSFCNDTDFICKECPFDVSPLCSIENRPERYKIVCERLAELEGRRTEFRVNDPVWWLTKKIWGKVVDITTGDLYDVGVDFGNGDIKWFNANGMYRCYEPRTLFFAEIPIPEEALYTTKREPPVLKEVYLARDNEGSQWDVMLLKEVDLDNADFCFVDSVGEGWKMIAPFDKELAGSTDPIPGTWTREDL